MDHGCEKVKADMQSAVIELGDTARQQLCPERCDAELHRLAAIAEMQLSLSMSAELQCCLHVAPNA